MWEQCGREGTVGKQNIGFFDLDYLYTVEEFTLEYLYNLEHFLIMYFFHGINFSTI